MTSHNFMPYLTESQLILAEVFISNLVPSSIILSHIIFVIV